MQSVSSSVTETFMACSWHPTIPIGEGWVPHPLLTVTQAVLLQLPLVHSQSGLGLAQHSPEVLGQPVVPHVQSAGLVLFCPMYERQDGKGGAHFTQGREGGAPFKGGEGQSTLYTGYFLFCGPSTQTVDRVQMEYADGGQSVDRRT